MGGRERRLPKRRYPGTRAPAPAEVRPGQGRGWAPVWILAAAAAAVIMASGGMVMNSISHMVPDLEPEPVYPEEGSWDEGISIEEVWPEETAAGEQELSEEEVRGCGDPVQWATATWT